MATVSDFYKEWLSPTPYVIAHTSGSTGIPKEIRLLKDDMIASAKATNLRFCIDSASVLALPLSVDYIAGKMMCVRALEARCKLLELPVSNTLTIDCDIDLLSIVPSQADCLIEHPEYALRIKNVLVGGAALSAERAKNLVNAGYKVYSSYGMTETCSHVALADLSSAEPVYHAMPGITFAIDSRDCLVIKAPAFSFGNLVTNDVVRLIDDSSFIWRGRFDNVINSGGIKISAEELEAYLASALSDRPFYIVACEDQKWGQVPGLVFEGREDEIGEISELIAGIVDACRLPKKFKAVKALPRTANGKIIRSADFSDL